MAADIDFLSGSCKQDVTDLICLSAHLNLNRRLEAGAERRPKEVRRSEVMRERAAHGGVSSLIGLAAKMSGVRTFVHGQKC